MTRAWLLPACWLAGAISLPAQAPPDAPLPAGIEVEENITYCRNGGAEQKLDAYWRKEARGVPIVLYIHGGGWRGGSKSRRSPFARYLEKGYTVLSISYRLAKQAKAPAAVEDCRCALRWVGDHGKKFRGDPKKIIVAGNSAGGHLSLLTGMARPEDGFDGPGPPPKVRPPAAIINFYGITDVGDLLGAHQRGWAVEWVPEGAERMDLARRVSPLTYVRRGLPPILIIHGDQDATVPYDHGVRLDRALREVGGDSELVAVSGGGHGNFSPEQNTMVWGKIFAFLEKRNLAPKM